MYNPNDLSGFISPFNVELAVNARNKADAYTKSKDALRSGSMAKFGADLYGKAVGQKFMDEANEKIGNIAGRANMFGNIMSGIGTLGSIGVMGGFNNIGSTGGGMTGIGEGQASLTPGIDVVPDTAPVINPGVFQGFETPSFGPIMNA